jgi:UDP-glucose 4-epimerase
MAAGTPGYSGKTALVTGGSGFFGSVLASRLTTEGWSVVSIDLVPAAFEHPQFTPIVGDIRNRDRLQDLFRRSRFDAVFHCAAMLAHGTVSRSDLWTSNVDGTRRVAEACREAHVPSLIYTSSNCLWGHNFRRPVREDDAPQPIELYGSSKWEGEKILSEYARDFSVVTIRCPTIIDAGRLGLLSILFTFIAEGRKVWVVGPGDNHYQFIYAQDLADAMIKAVNYPRSATFGIGADDVRSMREIYAYVAQKAGTGSRVASLPKWPTLTAMRLAHWLRLSPLGPYHYKMISEDFAFDTTAIKRELAWQPTLSNHEMLYQAYLYYCTHRPDIEARTNVSAHRKPVNLGIINVLKWIS